MKKVVVICAAISGLSTAFHIERMAEAHGIDIKVTVLEMRGRLGGRIFTHRSEGFRVEEGCNGFLDSKPSTLELCADLGISEKMQKSNDSARKRYVFLGGRLRKLPGSPLQFFTSDLISPLGKARLLCERFVPKKRGTKDETVWEFGCRRIGREAVTNMLDAFVTGVHAGDAKKISVAAAFPRIVEMEEQYGGLLRAMPKVARERRKQEGGKSSGSAGGPGGTLTAFSEGLHFIIEELEQRISGNVLTGAPVRSVERKDGGYIVRGDGKDSWDANAVVLACPAHKATDMLEPLDEVMAGTLASIPYAKAAIVALGFRRDEIAHGLDGFGYIAPRISRRDVLGILWTSSIFTNRAPEGMFLFRAIVGGAHRPELVSLDDEKLVRIVQGDLRAAMGVSVSPKYVRIFRWPEAIPQYHVGHLEKLERLEERRRNFPGLFLTGNAYRGVGMNDCTLHAKECAESVADYLK
ncbi:MAG: protoporphyrinogen oxidase [Planctomycetota bacterium]